MKKNDFLVLKIIGIMALAGALGGVGNYLMSDNVTIIEDVEPTSLLFKACILGIIAAGIVPIFLTLISSNLMDFSKSDEGTYNIKLLKFASFCLLASLFYNSFLDGANSLLKNQYKELKAETAFVKAKNEELEKRTDSIEEKTDGAYGIIKNAKDNINSVAGLQNKYGIDQEGASFLKGINDSVYLPYNNLLKNNSNDTTKLKAMINNLKAKDLIFESVIDNEKVIIRKANLENNQFQN